jgi:hypothetical protein
VFKGVKEGERIVVKGGITKNEFDPCPVKYRPGRAKPEAAKIHQD